MVTRAVLQSREAIKKVAGNDGTYKRGLEVQASSKMTEIEFSGDQLIHGKAKCEGSSPGDVYLLKFELDPSMPSARPQADCSCPSAQRGLCKHVVALLLTRADRIEADERLKARERLAAARANATGKAVLAEDLPPPPPREAAPSVTPTAVEAGPSEVAAVFQPMITNALAAGSALSAAGPVEASTSRAGKRVLPPWLQPKAKPEKGKGKADKKGRPSAEGIADIRTVLGKKRPLEVVAKQPPKRRARGAKIVREDSEEEGEDDETGRNGGVNVVPRERSTRCAAVAGSRRLRDAAEAAEEGGEEDDVMDDVAPENGRKATAVAVQRQQGATLGPAEDTGTLGYDWENWDSIVENMCDNEQDAGAGTSADIPNGRTGADSLWDGEDEDAEIPRKPASSRRGQRVGETVAGRGGSRSRRRAVSEDEMEGSAPVEDTELGRARETGGPGEGAQADLRQTAQQPNSDPRQAQKSAFTSAQAPDSDPAVPKKKKNSLFSLKNFKDAVRSLTDEEAGQLLSSMAPPRPMAPVSETETPKSEPVFGSLSVAEFAGSPKRSFESQPGPPPQLSAAVEDSLNAAAQSVPAADVQKMAAESGASGLADASEQVSAQPKAPSGEFNPLEAMLSVLRTSDSRAKRRAAKAAANAAAGAPPVVARAQELLARESVASEPPARMEPAREPVFSAQQPAGFGEKLPQSRAPPAENRRKEVEPTGGEETGRTDVSKEKGQLEAEPRSPSKQPRFGEMGRAGIEQTGSGSVAGPVKRKVKFGAMLRMQGELQT